MRINALEVIAAIALASPLISCASDTASDPTSSTDDPSGSEDYPPGSGDSGSGGPGSENDPPVNEDSPPPASENYPPVSEDGCTLTQGYWKNHPDAWPVSSLTLGTHTYTQAELISILNTPVEGNALIQIAHQLIAAKLNIAAGASVDSATNAAIAAADALIGSLVCPPAGSDTLSGHSDLTEALDDYNSGNTGPGHCDNEEPCGDGDCGGCEPPVCGNGVVEDGETCDDGNTWGGDGCSSSCQPESRCGNGIVEDGETCDDGNTWSGDGCSSMCTCECPS
ncbi:MAG: DUF4215 domain-containing protein [Kofleriaceae bacterium]|nr:DUF4215 domain-containing protein [Kofleriaceae bacterium]